jgi:hypothetical protein
MAGLKNNHDQPAAASISPDPWPDALDAMAAAPDRQGVTLRSAPLGPHSAHNVGGQNLHVIAAELKRHG